MLVQLATSTVSLRPFISVLVCSVHLHLSPALGRTLTVGVVARLFSLHHRVSDARLDVEDCW